MSPSANCRNCRFFVEVGGRGDGECHRGPPQLYTFTLQSRIEPGKANLQTMGIWPPVKGEQCCEAHEPDFDG